MDTINTLGRRKNATARVYLKAGTGVITVNGRPLEKYFPLEFLRQKLVSPLKALELDANYDIEVNVVGGGYKGQAEAVMLSIARALVKVDAEYKTVLRKAGMVTRDPRMVERKKPGRKKARRRFQFSKR